jgi:hypothetical protein
MNNLVIQQQKVKEKPKKQQRQPTRFTRGLKIFESGRRYKVAQENRYWVGSQSDKNHFYDVKDEDGNLVCNCPDGLKVNNVCKHCFAVLFYLQNEAMKKASYVIASSSNDNGGS